MKIKELHSFEEAWQEAKTTRRLFAQYASELTAGRLSLIRTAKMWFVDEDTKELWFVKNTLDGIRMLFKADMSKGGRITEFQYVYLTKYTMLFSSIKVSREEAITFSKETEHEIFYAVCL